MANANVIVKWKADTDEYNRKTREAGSVLDKFGAKGRQAGQAISQFDKIMGTSIGTLGKLTAGVGAASTALKVIKDAFFSSEKNVDAWGRSMESAKSLYQGFINALNNGDISGYLGKINDIVSAARKAYDALDDLATFNAFNQINVQKSRTGLSDAINDFREGTGSKAGVMAAGQKLKSELQQRAKMERDAYEAEVRKVAAQRGVSGDMLMKALSGSYGSYQALKNSKLTGTATQYTPGGMFGGSTAINVAVPANETEKLGQVLRQLNDTELQALQKLGAQAEITANEIAQVTRQVDRATRSTGGSGGGRTGGGTSGGGAAWAWINGASSGLSFDWANSISGLKGQISKYTKIYEEAGTESGRKWALSVVDGLKVELNRMLGNENLFGDIPDLAKTLKEIELPEQLAQGGRNAAEAWQMAASSIGQVGNALSSIEDPSMKVMGTIAMAIANVVSAAGQAMAAKDTTASGWAWIGAAAAITAEMVGTVAAIRSATAGTFAHGGEIKGNSYSGDNLTASVNAGEYVFNRAQLGNLAGQLRNGSQNGGSAQPYMTGEMIFLGLQSFLKRTGRGEILTTH